MGATKRCLISRAEIARRVAELAEQIGRDYAGRDLVMVGVLKGAFIFLADLVRALPFPVDSGFCPPEELRRRHRVRRGNPHHQGCGRAPERPGRADRGRYRRPGPDPGLSAPHLLSHQPRSLKICCLIDKQERRQVEVPLDYAGFVVEKGFLVGYGLDCGEQSRTLPEIFVLEKD